ncbi:hypothetical protein BJ170DRAFT_28010 [Xylariales sp. AK1849]|nr:hypothetical protein BJ170DRAFT_28010 [Xylariales sp. AK1849]
MHVAESSCHPSRSTLSNQKASLPKIGTTDAGGGRPYIEYAHIRALDDLIPPPGKRAGHDSRGNSPVHQRRTTRTPRCRDSRRREKRFGISDPAVWDAIRRTLAQQRRLSSLVLSEENPKELAQPSIPSRTSSQRRALNHFSRELEKYATVAGAAGRLPFITPTESDEKVSLHTVKPLLPYVKEIEAAGLAVTSEQQRSPQKGKRLPPGNIQLPTSHYYREPRERDLDGHYESSTPSTGSSSGSILQFTPPYAKSTTVVKPLPASSEKPRPARARGLHWLKQEEPVEKIILFPEQRQAVIREPNTDQRTQKGGDEPEPNCNVPAVPQGKRHVSVLTEDRSDRMVTREGLSSNSPANRRRSIVRPHIQDYVGHVSTDPAKRVHIVQERDEPHAPHFRRGRDMAQADLPRPATIKEEIEPSPQPHNHLFHHGSPMKHSHPLHPSPMRSRTGKKLSYMARSQPKSVQRATSPAPELPYTWKHTVSNTSSLERALNAASQRVDKMESPALRRQDRTAQPKLADRINRPTAARNIVHRENSQHHRHHPLLTQESYQMSHGPVTSQIHSRSLPAKPAAGSPPKTAGQGVPKPQRQPPAMPANIVSEKAPLNPPVVMPRSPSKLQDALSDLDVFFNADDACINDRDVLEGLEVAVKAAADDMYDALIRSRTGLRIRRFLADLKSIGAFDAELAVNQPAGQRPAARSLLYRSVRGS